MVVINQEGKRAMGIQREESKSCLGDMRQEKLHVEDGVCEAV